MISELANHLWQSTLFACVMGLLTLMLRRNRAAVRHGLWLAASIKFLVPFSLLIGLGSQVEWRKAPVVPHPRLDVVEQISEPLAILASPSVFSNSLSIIRCQNRNSPTISSDLETRNVASGLMDGNGSSVAPPPAPRHRFHCE